MLDLKPLGTRLIVKQDELKSEIIILSNAKSLELTEGVVLVTGVEVDRVGVGDRVYYGKYAGVPVERDREKYMLMDQQDILCIITPPVEVAVVEQEVAHA